jgi:hypothetical protein
MLKLATKFAPRRDEMDRAHRAGFRCAELWLDEAVLAEWEGAAALAREYPFEYALHFPNRLDLAPATLDNAIKLYRALACRCLVIHQPLFDRHHQALLRQEPGLRLAVENHRLDPGEMADWAERNPGLTLDVEHLWKFTLRDAPRQRLLEEVGRLLARFSRKVRHVHLPGYLPGLAEHRPMYASREMVFGVLSLLADAKFGGLIVSEADLEYQTPNDLRMDVLLFETWRSRHEPPAV